MRPTGAQRSYVGRAADAQWSTTGRDVDTPGMTLLPGAVWSITRPTGLTLSAHAVVPAEAGNFFHQPCYTVNMISFKLPTPEEFLWYTAGFVLGFVLLAVLFLR